eukprot:2480-Heterococcus_DN1.PRE.2
MGALLCAVYSYALSPWRFHPHRPRPPASEENNNIVIDNNGQCTVINGQCTQRIGPSMLKLCSVSTLRAHA